MSFLNKCGASFKLVAGNPLIPGSAQEHNEKKKVAMMMSRGGERTQRGN